MACNCHRSISSRSVPRRRNGCPRAKRRSPPMSPTRTRQAIARSTFSRFPPSCSLNCPACPKRWCSKCSLRVLGGYVHLRRAALRQWLSSISQNVANANTTGYKNVETDFSSLVDQIDNGNADFGGVSTRQVSLNALQGSVISTATPTDLAVQGAGL